SIKNDGHYCPATGDNRTDGLHEPLTVKKTYFRTSC
ncbi:phage terminase large subunit family protein, partial [Pantoea dispersa]